MDHQPLRRKYGSARHPILAARCALIRQHTMPEDIHPGIGQTLLLKRYVWRQLKAGLALPSGRCALFGIAPSRSTVDAGIGHSWSAVLESVSDLPRSWPRLLVLSIVGINA